MCACTRMGAQAHNCMHAHSRAQQRAPMCAPQMHRLLCTHAHAAQCMLTICAHTCKRQPTCNYSPPRHARLHNACTARSSNAAHACAQSHVASPALQMANPPRLSHACACSPRPSVCVSVCLSWWGWGRCCGGGRGGNPICHPPPAVRCGLTQGWGFGGGGGVVSHCLWGSPHHGHSVTATRRPPRQQHYSSGPRCCHLVPPGPHQRHQAGPHRYPQVLSVPPDATKDPIGTPPGPHQ